MTQPFWDYGGAPTNAGEGAGTPLDLSYASARDQWSAWDQMTIAGIDVPGHVVVVGRRAQRTDLSTVPGNSFARLTNLGYDPAEIDITITLWTEHQLNDYEALIKIVQPKPAPAPAPTISFAPEPGFVGPIGPLGQGLGSTVPNPGPQPLDVYHPALALMSIKSIYIHDVGLLVPGPVRGTRVATWRAAEFSPVVSGLLDTLTGSIESRFLPPQPMSAPTQPTTRPDLDPAATGT